MIREYLHIDERLWDWQYIFEPLRFFMLRIIPSVFWSPASISSKSIRCSWRKAENNAANSFCQATAIFHPALLSIKNVCSSSYAEEQTVLFV